MAIVCAPNPCPIILNSTCVFYTGANLIYTGINTNDSIQLALEKIEAKMYVDSLIIPSLQTVSDVGNTIFVPSSRVSGISIEIGNVSYQNAYVAEAPLRTNIGASDLFLAKLNGQFPISLPGYIGGFVADMHGDNNAGHASILNSDAVDSQGFYSSSYDAHTGSHFVAGRIVSEVYNTVFEVLNNGSVTATSYSVFGGTSQDFLKADGSLDSNIYITDVVTALGYTPEDVANKQNNLTVDGTGIKYATVDAVNAGLLAYQYTNEMAQDAIGTILSNTSTINFSYDDGIPLISASVNPNSITAVELSDTINISEFVNNVGYELTSNKGMANGYASLDGGGKVPISQLPNSIMEYKGVYDAATNTPTLIDGTGNAGDVYRVSVAGSGVNGLNFVVGDYAVYNGTIWEKAHSGADNITSVFGRLGTIVAQTGDYNTGQVTEVVNKNYQTDNQKLYNDATSSIQTQLNSKQETLVSGVNIKTINAVSLLGAGDTNPSTSTKLLSGCELINNGATFTLNPGTYEIVSNLIPITRTIINFLGAINVTPLYTRTILYLDNTGTLNQLNGASGDLTPLEKRDNLFIGTLSFFGGVILAPQFTPSVAYDEIGRFTDLSETIGVVNRDGNLIGANGPNLQFNKGAGHTFRIGSNYVFNRKVPDVTTDVAFIPVPAGINAIGYRNGVGGWSYEPFSGSITPNFWDDGSGIKATVSNNKFTIQRIYFFNGTDTFLIYLGQTEYGSMDDAIAAVNNPDRVIDPATSLASLRSSLIVKKNTIALNNIAEAMFLEGPKFNGGASGSAVSSANFQGVYLNSVTPQITTTVLLGSVDFKRGSTADTDNVFRILNGAGGATFTVTGNGNVTASSFIKSGGLSTQFLKADGSIDSTSYQPSLGYTPENIANKSDSYTVSSSTTYASTKALVDGLSTKAPVSGSANYIQNQNTSAQSANMWINGTGKFNTGLYLNRSSLTTSAVLRYGTGVTDNWFIGQSPLGTSTNDLSFYSYGINTTVFNLDYQTGAATFASTLNLPAVSRITLGTAWNTGKLSLFNGPTEFLNFDVPNGRVLNNLGSYLTSSGAVSRFGSFDNFATSLVTNNVERLRVTNTGNVLIGTTTNNGVDKLQVNGSAEFGNGSYAIRISTDGVLVWGIQGDENGQLSWDAGKAIIKATAGSTLNLGSSGANDNLVIDTNGNVGIGTTSPSQKLSVNGSVSATSYTGSATLTGTPTAPTAAPGTNTTQIATTEFVSTNFAPVSGSANYINNQFVSSQSANLNINGVGIFGSGIRTFGQSVIPTDIDIFYGNPSITGIGQYYNEPTDELRFYNNIGGSSLLAINRGSGVATFSSIVIASNGLLAGISGTATSNFIPKFTSSSTIGNSQIYDDSAIVAIGSGGSNPGKFNVFDAVVLGTTAGNYRNLFSIAGSANNAMYANNFLVRESNGTDWNSAGLLNGIQVDASFTTPATAKTFWERIPVSDKQYFGSNGVRDLTIDSAVHGVGIGIESPTNYGAGTSSLSINGSTDSGYIDIYNNGGRKGYMYSTSTSFNLSTTTGDLIFETGGVEKSRISYAGNFLIGTTTDNTVDKLQVNGNARIDGQLISSSDILALSGNKTIRIVASAGSNFIQSYDTTSTPYPLTISHFDGTNIPLFDIKATSTVANGSLTANSFVKSGGTSSQFLKADGSVDSNTYATALPYKVYTALLSQTGTGAPSATILENTLGGTIVWTRNTTGIYEGTLSGVFTDLKTVCFISFGGNGGTAYTGDHTFQVNRNGVNVVEIRHTRNDALADDFKVSIEIRIYP